MTNLEHLIENTLVDFEKGYDVDDIRTGICKDPNLKGVRIPTDQIYEICQYVWCTYLDNGNNLKKYEVKRSTMTNAEKLAKEMLENLDDFAEILFSGVCNLHNCDDCPLYKARQCSDKNNIRKWLEQEAEDD